MIIAILSCLPDLDALPPGPGDGAGEAAAPPNPCGNTIVELQQDGGGEQCDPGDASDPGCVDCKVVCENDSGIDPTTGHCYFRLDPSAADFRSAAEACARSRAHVVTIASEQERQIVEQLDAGSYWVGLSFAPSVGAFTVGDAFRSPLPRPDGIETGWPHPPCSGPCPGCYGLGLDGGDFALLDGAVAPAASCSENVVPCVARVAANRWAEVECTDAGAPLATICERDPQGTIVAQTCGGVPCFTTRASKKLYLLYGEPVTADQATCPGSQLLHIDSDEERQDLVRALADVLGFVEQPEIFVWIGLHTDASGAWVWDDGTTPSSDLHLWGEAQPPAGGTGRARLRLNSHYDSGLVYANATPGEKSAYLCEVR
ncbi:MAG TPA: C-type lectin domain-containing protein [Labilithrix sp.]